MTLSFEENDKEEGGESRFLGHSEEEVESNENDSWGALSRGDCLKILNTISEEVMMLTFRVGLGVFWWRWMRLRLSRGLFLGLRDRKLERFFSRTPELSAQLSKL